MWCGLSPLQFEVELKTYSVLYTLLQKKSELSIQQDQLKKRFVKFKWNESQKCKQKRAVRYDSFLSIKICGKQKSTV